MVCMLIECPRCVARYEVADGLIGPAGKSVRCAKCGMVWVAGRSPVAEPEAPLQWPEPPRRAAGPEAQEAPSPPPPPPAEPREDPALAELRAAQAAKGAPEDDAIGATARRRSLVAAAVIGWLATIAVLGSAGWGAYAYREAVIEAWPPSERVYLALGLRS
jgi:predicted Zn finger-like uncharacterized protein